MRLKQQKLAALRFLRFQESQEPPCWHTLSSRERTELLLWLDHSGLALYFLRKLQDNGAEHSLPPEVLGKLLERRKANRTRARLLAEQLGEVVTLLEAKGVPYAVLKGFSLSPEFCPDPVLRHQTDIDLLLDPRDVPAAAEAFPQLGYSRLTPGAENDITFATPLLRTPSARDNIYAPREKKLEIHLGLWEPVFGVTMQSPVTNLQEAPRRNVMGVEFCMLPLEQRFVLQLLHAFRHLLSGWIRPSWAYEIAWFLNGSYATSEFCERSLGWLASEKTANACALALSLALSLAEEVFRCPIPRLLRQNLVERMPRPMQLWSQRYGERFLLPDVSGSKLGLLIERPFYTESGQWRDHLTRRVFPFHGRPRLGAVATDARCMQLRHSIYQSAHFLRRLKFHVISDLELGWEALRARADSGRGAAGGASGGLLSRRGV